jgi:hypothetical protein
MLVSIPKYRKWRNSNLRPEEAASVVSLIVEAVARWPIISWQPACVESFFDRGCPEYFQEQQHDVRKQLF